MKYVASRSPCPIGRASRVLGDRWVLLLLREAFLGVDRFDDFFDRLGISRATLTSRLALMVGTSGAMRVLAGAGLRVPEDVSVVGFDDLPEAAFFEPPLTTVRQDFAALGRQAVDYLLTLVAHPETPHHQRTLYPRLVERLSTARAPV